MGARKRNKAEQAKENRKKMYYAVLNNCPTSPRKMRLVCDLIRGVEINNALNILRYCPKHPSRKLEKLLLSAIANWKLKNEGIRMEDSRLFIREIHVDEGRALKRVQPAPQGRAYHIKKRSNHVTMILDNIPEKKKLQTETVNKQE